MFLSQKYDKKQPFPKNLFKWGHRGCRLIDNSGNFIEENTANTIQLAIKYKLPGIEVDLRKSADNKLVLIHDKSIKNPRSHTPLFISGLRASEIKDHVPNALLLDELLTDFPQKTYLNLEIKDERVTTSLPSQLPQKTIISSFLKKPFYDLHATSYSGELGILIAESAITDQVWTWKNIENINDLSKKLTITSLNIPHTASISKLKALLPKLPSTITKINIYTQPHSNQHPLFDTANNPERLEPLLSILQNYSCGAFIDDPTL